MIFIDDSGNGWTLVGRASRCEACGCWFDPEDREDASDPDAGSYCSNDCRTEEVVA